MYILRRNLKAFCTAGTIPNINPISFDIRAGKSAITIRPEESIRKGIIKFSAANHKRNSLEPITGPQLALTDPLAKQPVWG